MRNRNNDLIINISSVHYCFAEDAKDEKGSSPFHRVVRFTKGSWNKIYFTAKSARFNEKTMVKAPGKLFKQTLNFQVPGEDPLQSEELNALRDRPLLVKITYNNGKQKLIGNTIGPKARLTADLSLASNKSGFAFKIECTDIHSAFWLEE